MTDLRSDWKLLSAGCLWLVLNFITCHLRSRTTSTLPYNWC